MSWAEPGIGNAAHVLCAQPGYTFAVDVRTPLLLVAVTLVLPAVTACGEGAVETEEAGNAPAETEADASSSGFDGSSGDGPESGGDADAGGTEETTAAPGPDGGGSDAACVTDVPCTHDGHCVALPGHGCNLTLPEPRCQEVQCGGEGSACDDDSFCNLELLCLDGACAAPVDDTAGCAARCIAEAPRRNIQFGDDYCVAEHVVDACFAACEGYPHVGWWRETCGAAEIDFTQMNISCTDAAVCMVDVLCSNHREFALGSPEACQP